MLVCTCLTSSTHKYTNTNTNTNAPTLTWILYTFKNTLPSARASQLIWKMHTNTKYRYKYRYKYKCAGHWVPTVHPSYLKTTFSDGTYVPDRQKPEFNTKCDQTIITPAAMLHSVLGSFHMKVASRSSKDKYCSWFPELAFRWFLPLTVFQLSTNDSVLNYLTLDRVDILGAVLPRLPLSV